MREEEEEAGEFRPRATSSEAMGSSMALSAQPA